MSLPLVHAMNMLSQTATSVHADAKVQLGIVVDSGKLAQTFKSK